MNLRLNTLLAAIVLALCLEAAAAEARPKKRQPGVGIGPGQYGGAVGVRTHHSQIKLRPKRSEVPGRGFIPPSVAAKRAQRAYGGKILAVRLQGAIYVVKLRGRGYVRRVRVHAITGRVLGP